MRIVHFDQMFHPEFGDQINILPKYQVKHGHEVYIVTGKWDVPHPRFANFADDKDMDKKDKEFENNTGVKIIRIDIKKFVSGRAVYKRGYKKIVDNLKPDVLFCHFNDTLVGMHYTWISSKLKYPVVFDSHMLRMASNNPFREAFAMFYRLFLTPVIKRNNLKVIRTQDDDYVNKYLGIPEEQTPFISFGSDTSLFYPDPKIKKKFRKKHDIAEDDFVIVYIGKLNRAKGGKLLAEAFRKKFETKKNIVLITVGNLNGEYGEEVKELFKKSNNRIINFPTQKYMDLPKFYQSADLCVFPRQCSLSFYDAQACALPVISEDNNVNIGRLSHRNGFIFKSDNIEDFRKKILECVELSNEEYQDISQNAYNFIKDNYDYEEITREYTEILIQEYESFNRG